MIFSKLDVRKGIILVSLVGVPLLSIHTDPTPQDKVFWAVRPFLFASNLVQSSFSHFASGVRGTTNDYLYLVALNKENRNLTKKNSQLRAELGALTELKLENKRLKNLLNFKQNTQMKLLPAQVIGNDLLPEHNTLTINRGTNHGIKKYMAAITDGGVLGYIISPSSLTSKVLLLTDRYSSIDAIVQRTRSRGLVEGLSKNACQLSYMKRGAIQPGDLIVTSGLQNIFPKGFPIATVKNINRGPFAVTKKIKLKPVINPLNVEELFIILNARNEDLSSKTQALWKGKTPPQEPQP